MPFSTPPAVRAGYPSTMAAAWGWAIPNMPAWSSFVTEHRPLLAGSSGYCGTIRLRASCGMRTQGTRRRSGVPAKTASTFHSWASDRMAEALTLWRNGRVATCDESMTVFEQGALLTRGGRIEWVGDESALPEFRAPAEVRDLDGAWITPGLIDCHTHLVFAGTRATEYAQRLKGRSYAEIARAGGGILSTMRAVRAASEQQLFDESAPRLQALLAEGVTTIEIKSGYGLTLADEEKMLRVGRALQRAFPATVKTTLLAAHTLPPEYKGRAADYIELICEDWLPRLHAENLIDAV